MPPEQLHAALNHLPVFGVVASFIPLVLGLVLRRPLMTGTGTAMVAVFALSVAMVMWSGEEAEERMERRLDDQAGAWLHEHEERAERVGWSGYVLSALAVAATVLAWRRPKLHWAGGAVTMVAGVGVMAGLLWVASAGGKIMHPEFRPGASSAEQGAAQGSPD